jgi:peptidyl-prolyl cis-trans isomerase SurA
LLVSMTTMKRIALIAILLATPAYAVTVDRIAAVIDRQVLTVSEVNQLAEVRFFPRAAGRSDDDYRHDILEALIAQALRYRDVERFGAQDIPKDSIEARLVEIQHRFASPAELDAALARAELTPDELRALIKRQLQVEAYIQERFAPMVFVANEDIADYYNGPWRQQRVARGLPVPPLNDVREEIRTLIRSRQLDQQIETWTTQLRARANVDVYAWR